LGYEDEIQDKLAAQTGGHEYHSIDVA